MLVETFDGFVAGLLVCPELIPPSAWLPGVWGGAGGATPAFSGLDDVDRLLGPLMAHYNAVARTLSDAPERYAPLFPIDETSGETIWECWIEGFAAAMALRPAAWAPLHDADEATVRAIAGLETLIAVANRDGRFSKLQRDALTTNGHSYIAGWVKTLNRWRRADTGPRAPAPTPAEAPDIPYAKVGRNAPCPCGSGRKYKRCHGAN